jgi:hypothetical protein
VKESPLAGVIAPPQSVEGEDWIVLQPRASHVKKLFKQKSPTKLSVIGIQGGLVLG